MYIKLDAVIYGRFRFVMITGVYLCVSCIMHISYDQSSGLESSVVSTLGKYITPGLLVCLLYKTIRNESTSHSH